LSQRGYATAGFHGGGNVSPEFGFERGFDTYTQARIADAAGFSAVRAWLSERREGPVFLFLHTYHAHDPYLPGAELRERFAPGYTGAIVADRQALRREAEAHCAGRPGCDAWRESHRLYWSRVDRRDPRDLAHLSGLYDAQIRELDTAVERVLLAIRELPGDTLVVMLSDHGEAFGEHGELMHATLHEEITRVPLLVRHPRAKHTWGRRVEQPVSLVDVAPSLLDWLGFEVPASFQGRALSSAPASPAAHGAPPDPRDILSEFAQRGELALVRGSRKILLRTAGGPLPRRTRRVLARVAAELGLAADAQRFRQIQLFDLDADPGELFDLGPAHPDFEPMLRAALSSVAGNRAHRAGLAVVEAPSVELPDQTLRQLEALGYLE
jgi:arylsulfatase A-like enzyme